jgi:hypothetical protein
VVTRVKNVGNGCSIAVNFREKGFYSILPKAATVEVIEALLLGTINMDQIELC